MPGPAVMARTPGTRRAAQGQRSGTSTRGLSQTELREVLGTMERLVRQLGDLERQRVITTEEAVNYRRLASGLTQRARGLASPRRVSVTEARRRRRQGRLALTTARRNMGLAALLRRRAATGRSTRGLRILHDFRVSPPVIRIHEGEATRISFVLRRPVRTLNVAIWQYEASSEERPGGWHFPTWTNPLPGYQDTFWDGTWQGMRNRPPTAGTYRVRVEATDHQGYTERVFDQIRVENPRRVTVLPRNGSGYDLAALRFDGAHAVLTDTGGNAIRMRAVSGLRRSNPLSRGRDWTAPRFQWRRGLGPLPERSYQIARNGVQQPALLRAGRGAPALRYPTGGTAARWGPRRAPLSPNRVVGPDGQVRTEFFLHLDVTNDGTAGCIGIHPADEGKFNQLMSLISRMRNRTGTVPVLVRYRR
jgi:hypothetical protein